MASEQVLWNPLLNFVYRANKAGDLSEGIAMKAVQFYKPEAIFQAKEFIIVSCQCSHARDRKTESPG